MRISGGGGGCLTRFVVTALIVVIVLLVTGVFLVRTEGGRSLIEEHISKRMGTDVKVAQARIGWPYELVLKNVTSAPVAGHEKAGFAAREVRIGLGLATRWRIDASRFEVDLVKGEDSTWRPICMARLGVLPWEGAEEISRLTEDARDRVRLRLDDGVIRWHAETEGVIAAAERVRFEMTPVRVRRRRLYYYYLDIYSWMAPNGARVHDTEREWLATDTSDYVELYSTQSAGGSAAEAGEEEWDDQQATGE